MTFVVLRHAVVVFVITLRVNADTLLLCDCLIMECEYFPHFQSGAAGSSAASWCS